MNNIHFMHVPNGTGDLAHNIASLLFRESSIWLLLELSIQVSQWCPFEHQMHSFVSLEETIECNDVWMLEMCEYLNFPS